MKSSGVQEKRDMLSDAINDRRLSQRLICETDFIFCLQLLLHIGAVYIGAVHIG